MAWKKVGTEKLKPARPIAKERIGKAAVKTFGDTGAYLRVAKYLAFDGRRRYGWWYRPYCDTPMFLGKNQTEALETLYQIGEQRNI